MTRVKFGGLMKRWKTIGWLVLIIAAGVAGTLTQRQWMPHAQRFMAYIENRDLDEHEHGGETAVASANPDTLTLSPTAWKNIGLVTKSVEPADFFKVVSVPAMVVERPGRSQIEITAPMTGVVTHIYPLERQAIDPGTPLFDLRLTHEDVVTAQSGFLTQLQGLDVINQELQRLKSIGEGVIPGKRLIEKEYQRDQAAATLAAIRQSLLLHGMTPQQIEDMEKTRDVLKEITVVAPPYSRNHEHAGVDHQYHVQSIQVNRGESVTAGQLLGTLADHCLLYVEGKAFEDDVYRLVQAARDETTVQVVPVSGGRDPDATLNLTVQSVSDQVEQQSRALKFYLLLPNERAGPAPSPSQREFPAWKYRPGQRMEVKIPTSGVLKNKIVLPPDAVVIDGPNAFVFEQNGKNFDRIDVHVLFRDKESVVLENDGQLVGSVIAMNGAYQMHLAMKNQSGGAIDPHAGHSH